MSQLDQFLLFAFNHQTIIIESLFAIILTIVILWLFSHLRHESNDIDDSLRSISNIEDALKRVLETTETSKPKTAGEMVQLIKDDDHKAKPADAKAHGKPTSAPAAGAHGAAASHGTTIATPAAGTHSPTTPAAVGTPTANGAAPVTPAAVPTTAASVPIPTAAPGAAQATPAATATTTTPAPATDAADSVKLKAEAEVKDKKLEALEEELKKAKADLETAKAAPGASAPNTDDLKEKIKALEARLAEYEIIENDIANLSLYKEENVRLKEELKKAQSHSAASAAVLETHMEDAAKTKKTENVAEATPVATAPKAEPVAKVESAPKVEVASETKSPADEILSKPIDSEKLLSEFNTLVAEGANKDAAAKPVDNRESSEKLIEEFENFMKGS